MTPEPNNSTQPQREPHREYPGYGYPYGYAGEFDSPGESEVRRFLGIFRRRIWFLIAAFVLVAAVGTYRAMKAPKAYRATAKLLVERFAPRIQGVAGVIQDTAAWDPEYYETQTQLLRSRVVLEIAMEDPDIKAMFAQPSPAAFTAAASSSATRDPRPPAPPEPADTRNLPAAPKARGASAPGEGGTPEPSPADTWRALTGAAPPPPPQPWERLRGYVQAKYVKDTHFMEVSVESAAPREAAVIANAVARAFAKYHVERRLGMHSDAYIALKKERDREEEAYLQAQRELQAFRESAVGVSLNTAEQDQPAIRRMVELNKRLMDVQLQRIKVAAESKALGAAAPNAGSGAGPKAGSQGANGPDEEDEVRLSLQTEAALDDLEKRLTVAEDELSALVDTYGPEHPKYQAARRKVNRLREQVLMAQVSRLAMLGYEEEELLRYYNEQRESALHLAKEVFNYSRLQREVDRHHKLLDILIDRLREVDLSSGFVKTNVHVVEEASTPRSPFKPNRLRMIMMALFAGLFAGVVLSLFVEHVDDTIKSPEDIKRLRLPLLGFVPDISPKIKVPGAQADQEFAARATIMLLAQNSSVAEAYRAIRTGLFAMTGETGAARAAEAAREDARPPSDVATAQLEGERLARRSNEQGETKAAPREPGAPNVSGYEPTRTHPARMLLISSSGPGEGKTTTATNLAIAIAQAKKRVLLIDADFNRPAVHKAFGVNRKVGLSNLLTNGAALEDVVVKITDDEKPLQNLDILTAGPGLKNPAELLESPKMHRFLTAVRETYDWILIDTPPILLASHAGILSAYCDGVIMVVKSGRHNRTLVNRALESMEAVGATMLGTILNKMVLSRFGRYYSDYYYHSYYRSQYYYYYRPQPDDDSPAGRAADGLRRHRRAHRPLGRLRRWFRRG
ncbi:MAG: polysaccharide biosynthesis tyrosine autokinase [Planctomycetes bacterium]|nr:polysaccharide biosynthesis tyrosine autokinase [Planctomycetota bacterium]